MHADAIKRIEELSAQGELSPELFDVPGMVVPGDARVESLEQFLWAPRRMRAKFQTERIPDFCRYVEANAADDGATAIFVKPDGSGATAVLDYGVPSAPKWGDHRATLALKHTAEFAAVEQICGRDLAQRDVTDWIEDWRHMIQPLIEGETEGSSESPVSIPRAVAAIRKIDLKAIMDTAHEDGDFKARRTSMEQIEASSGGSRIPGLFRVSCRVYPETEAREIDLRLSVLTSRDKPSLRFRMIGRDALLKAIAEEVELDLAERLNSHRVYVGSI